jgi:hypothetical protein
MKVGAAYCRRRCSVDAPIGLGALAASEMQLQIDGALRRSNAVDVIAHDAAAAAITFLAQPLKNLRSAVRMGVEQARDARLERIKFAGTRLAAPPCKARLRQPGRDRAPMESPRERAVCAIVKPWGNRGSYRMSRKRSRPCPRCQARSWPSRDRMWRECLDPAVANGRWYGLSPLGAVSQ